MKPTNTFAVKVLLLCKLLLFAATSYGVNIQYISSSGAGTKNGSSWENAFPADSLQYAIKTAKANSQIWIKAGHYPITKPISMRDSVEIYGAFTGFETTVDQRTFDDTTHFDAQGISDYIIKNDTVNNSAVLDGVWMQKAEVAIDSKGGTFRSCVAFFNKYGVISSGHFSNCQFILNTSDGVFASSGNFESCLICANEGIGVCGGTASFTNCIINGNKSYGVAQSRCRFVSCKINDNNNSAVYDSYSTFINCNLNNNVYCGVRQSNDFFMNCSINGNGAYGIFTSNAVFYNCVISQNNNAGVASSKSIFTNCTVVNNGQWGFAKSSDTLRNCIIWNNPSNGYEKSAYVEFTAISPYLDVVLENNNILLDSLNCALQGPHFVNPTRNDFHLMASSPLINKGSNEANDSLTDMNGWPRIMHQTIDLGAYEFGYEVKLRFLDETGKPLTNTSVSVNKKYYATSVSGFITIFVDTSKTDNAFQATSVYYLDTIRASYSLSDTLANRSFQFTRLKQRQIVYVSTSGAGLKNGTSWANAYPATALQTAINKAPLPAQVWLTQGIYTLTKSLTLRNDVEVLGGFIGTETTSDQRDFENNITTLTALNLLAIVNDTVPRRSTAILDGVVITNGQKAGIIAAGGVFKNCRIDKNLKTGIYLSSARFINCYITNNVLAGVFDCSGVFEGCEFSQNQIGLMACSATVINSVIGKNTNSGLSSLSGFYHNCIITQNATVGLFSVSAFFTNTTIANNQYEIFDSKSTFNNCVVWGKIENSGVAAQYNHTAISSIVNGNNCIVLDTKNDSPNGPHFIDPSEGDYNLAANSPCVNTGNNDFVKYPFDFRYNSRIINARVDMGAIERGYSAQFKAVDVQDKALSNAVVRINNQSYYTDSLGIAYFAAENKVCYYTAQHIAFSDTLDGTFLLNKDTLIVLKFEKTRNQTRVYVKPNATGFGYSWNEAIGSIPAAILRCVPGGEVWVAKGSYAKSIFVKSNVKIIGGFDGTEQSIAQRVDSAKSTIDAEMGLENDSAQISHFVVKQRFGSIAGKATHCSLKNSAYIASSARLFNCSITATDDSIALASSGGYVSNCTIENAKYGVYNLSNTLFSNCIIRNNTYGILAYAGKFTNCNILNNSIGIKAQDTCKITNTIIWGNTNQQVFVPAPGPEFSYCAIQGGYNQSSGNKGNNIALDANNNSLSGPQFRNPNSNWNVLLSSPCLNVGQQQKYTPQSDYYGNQRIVGSSIDLGITEQQFPFDTTQRKGIIQNNTTSCYGDSIELAVDFSAGIDSIVWSSKQTSTQIRVAPRTNSRYFASYWIGLFHFTDTVSIKVSTPAKLNTPQEVCYKQTPALNPGTFKTYRWNDGTTLPTHEIDFDTPKKYTVTVVDSLACKTSDSLVITKINPLPSITLPSDTSVCNGLSLQLKAPLAQQYAWSNNQTTQSITVSDEKKYSVTIIDANHCHNADTITVHVLKPYTEQIGMISYDSLTGSHVVIAWNKHRNKRTERFVVYREGTSSDSWDSVGGRTIMDTALIIDRSANLNEQAYKYKLQTIDSNCHQRAESAIHRTMHVHTSPSATNNSITIEWNAYIGFNADPKSYSVLRFEPNGTITTIKTLAANGSGDLSYTDLSPIKGSYYRIAYKLQELVSPLIFKGDCGPFSQSFSNMSEASLVDIDEPETSYYAIAVPNPANDEVTIYGSEFEQVQTLQLTDTKAATFTVLATNTNASEIKFSVKYMAAGLYSVQVPTKSALKSIKLLIK